MSIQLHRGVVGALPTFSLKGKKANLMREFQGVTNTCFETSHQGC